jgi:mycofactocin precursor
MHEDQTRTEPDTVDNADDLVEEVLVEEVSIDGMCGVY